LKYGRIIAFAPYDAATHALARARALLTGLTNGPRVVTFRARARPRQRA